MKKSTKILTAGCAAALAFGMLMGTGCSDSAFNDNKLQNTLMFTANEVYAASAVSGVALLGLSDDDEPNYGAGESTSGKDGECAENGYVGDASRYLADFENVLSKDIGHIITDNTDAAYTDYEFVMQMHYGEETVKMYYNEAQSVSENEIDDDGDVDETETVTALNGIAVYGNEKYAVLGLKKVETEGREEEFSIKFKTIKDESNFVEFAYESEKDGKETEISYELKVVVNGLAVTEYELETENENGATEITYSVKKYDENGFKKYEIKKDSRRENIYFVTMKENGIKKKIVLEKTENGYEILSRE